MILLDTNVLSELMLMRPHSGVQAWFDVQISSNLHTSTITIAEILYGLRIMPAGQRRDGLRVRFEPFLREMFGHRILGFDEAAARGYGDIMGERKEMGRPMSIPDGQIAAIARANNLALATRNIRDFEGIGLDLINPFDGAA